MVDADRNDAVSTTPVPLLGSLEPDAAPDTTGRAPLDGLVRGVAARCEKGELAAALAVSAHRRTADDEVDELYADLERVAGRFGHLARLVDARREGELVVVATGPEEAPWAGPGTAIDVVVDDAPFQLSTALEELEALGLRVTAEAHPVIGVERDAANHVVAVSPARGSAARESVIAIDLADRLDAARAAHVVERLRVVLGDAFAVTTDFPRMRAAVEAALEDVRTAAAHRDADEVEAAADFLTWVLGDHAILLGCRSYAVSERDGVRGLEVVAGSGLGILANEATSTFASWRPLEGLAPGVAARITNDDLLTVARTNRVATVHRRTRMTSIGVKVLDEHGSIVGERRILALLAHKALVQPATTIPLLKRKLASVLEAEDVVDGSRDERSLRALFEALPKHELFAADDDDIRATVVGLDEAQRRGGTRVLRRLDPSGRATSVTVALPRDRFSATIRHQIQEIVAARHAADSVDYHLSMLESGQAVMNFMVHHADGAGEALDLSALTDEIARATRSWDDRLRAALAVRHGARDGAALATRWAGRLPAGYTERTDPVDAVDDLAALADAVRTPEGLRTVLRLRGDSWRVVLFVRGAAVELSAFLPVLESLGLVVVEERPYSVSIPLGDGNEVAGSIQDFGVRPRPGLALDLVQHATPISAAAQALAGGRADADSLNALVSVAGIDWEDVAVLRAYRRYRRQLGTSFTEAYQNDALVEHPDVALALLELLAARLDPGRADDPTAVAAARETLASALERVDRLDQDRILRGYAGLVEATLRTNRWVPRSDDDPPHALSLKLDSATVPEAPRPLPHVEVFVHHPDVEGIHLRGGPVARGGLRWSDRLEDFRTEVLGLMKAQMVKNAIIVPVGAKGGFVVRNLPEDREERTAAVRRAYESYISSLLDITDDVVDGAVVRPGGVRPADGDDPYLVVAADKGTATFSDVANAIATERGFWLRDGFASGGSSGYDHKRMGITARGAWVAVTRHFRELGIDVATDPVRVVGIGDMSGDVFGNGMLRSRALRLVAAFDHRDIVIDPNPDPDASYAERERLFATPGTTWQDLDRSTLSAGGGVWSRQAKSIDLSPEAVEVLGLPSDRMSPPELISAILRAHVDLLFAGGIGTFVRAATERDDEVGDRANDAIRITADELGARVVGEGGNLALTQQARIAYARRGGRVNTDAIDNAAGVATSDREVNLKILLSQAIAQGDLIASERDAFLESMTDGVARAVLDDVDQQTWALSNEADASPDLLDAYERFMSDLESAGHLDRAVDVLPDEAEVARRRQAGAGLTRPELSVLLAAAKLDVRRHLLASSLFDDPRWDSELRAYFPQPAVERFGHLLGGHRLRRELVATRIAGRIVDRMGVTWVWRTANEFGTQSWEVVAAWLAAVEVSSAESRWAPLARVDERTDPALQRRMKDDVDRLVDALARAYLRGSERDPLAIAQRDAAAFAELESAADEIAPSGLATARRRRAEDLIELGVDDDQALAVTGLRDLAVTADVAAAARDLGRPVPEVGAVFMALGEALPFAELADRLSAPVEGQWSRWQQRGLLDELRSLRTTAARWALRTHPDAAAARAVAAFLDERAEPVARARTLVAQLARDEDAGLEGVAVALRALRDAVTAS